MTGSVLNIVIKFIAVILAIFLWFNVITQKQYEHELTLKVTVVELPAALGAVTPFPDSLTIRVMAEGKKLLRSDWKKAGLRIKANRLRQGINHLGLDLETVALVRPEGISLLDFPDAEPMTVRLDRLDSMLIPVASRMAVVTNEGYMIISGEETISPLSTMAVGPASLIKSVDSIYTEQKIIDDIEETVTLTLALEVPAGMEISLAHDSAAIEIPVDKIRRKQFENIPVLTSTARGGRVIVDPDRLKVDIEGPASLIDSLGENQIKISVTAPPGVTGGYFIPIIKLPANCSTVSITPDSVRLLVSP